jgi:hypothetical protein
VERYLALGIRKEQANALAKHGPLMWNYFLEVAKAIENTPPFQPAPQPRETS